MRRLILPVLLITSATPALAQNSGQAGRFPQNDLTNRLHDGPTNQAQAASVAALQRTLTELQQLQLQTKQAHWNVSGTLFWSLHKELQEHYEGVAKYADEVAERLLQIGSSSDGRANTIVRNSRIPEFPGGFVDDAQVIAWFTRYYHDASQVVGEGIKATNDSDPTTSNLFRRCSTRSTSTNGKCAPSCSRLRRIRTQGLISTAASQWGRLLLSLPRRGNDARLG